MSGLTHPARGVIVPDRQWTSIGSQVTGIPLRHEGFVRWWIAFAVSLALVGLLVLCLFWVLYEGVGVWGNNVPVTWALDIVSYDWWIGVASGGLFVSASLLLLNVAWRGVVNRMTETMALIAAAAAGLYPIVHLGRPWFFYWNLPYPNTFLLWPQFRSPLYWDAIDIISYLLICLCFWYAGLLPDLAGMRDRAIEQAAALGERRGGMILLKAKIYGIAAMGWRGSIVHWRRWEQAYRTIAALGIVVVVSLQTGAAVMFAGSLEPGWHDTLLPVTFLCGALFAGVAVIAVLLVIMRAVFPLRELITVRELDLLGVLLLILGCATIYCYAAEFLTTRLAGTGFGQAALTRRFTGPNAWAAWCIIACALLPVQLFWFPFLRRSAAVLFVVGLLVAFGMWADHFMTIVITLQHDFLPSAAHSYAIDAVGAATFLGTVGLFLFLLLLAVRYLPMLSIVGMRRRLVGGPVHVG